MWFAALYLQYKTVWVFVKHFKSQVWQGLLVLFCGDRGLVATHRRLIRNNESGHKRRFHTSPLQKLNLVGHWNFKDNVKYHLSVANTYHDYKFLQTYFNHIVASKIYWQYSGALRLWFDFFIWWCYWCAWINVFFLTSAISHCHHV